MEKNYRVVLNDKPGVNTRPRPEHFGYEECPYPARQLRQNEVLLKTCYISIDPASRGQMDSEEMGIEFLPAWDKGETIEGLGGIGVVVESNHPRYLPGDLLQAAVGWPWILYSIQNMEMNSDIFSGVNKSMIHGKPSLILSLLGMTGLTALIGVQDKCHIERGANQAMVISAAAGACGSLAGQIAKLEGCETVVGICGTNEKCSWLVNELGFDYAINYKTESVLERLKTILPDGVDIYFDSVGGGISNNVIRWMTKNSTHMINGQISIYNNVRKDKPYPPPPPADVAEIFKTRNISQTDFIVLEHPERYEDGILQLEEWYSEGKIKVRETIEKGLENAGKAFVSMMNGGNIGKQLVHVADPYIETTL